MVMSEQTLTGRCDACGARLPAGAPWCSLCFAVQGQADVAPVAEVPADDAPVAEVPVDEVPADDAPAQRGVHVAADPADDDQVRLIADRMLAELAAQGSAPTRASGLSGLLSSAGGRAGVAVAGVLLFTVVTLGLLALAGSLL